MAIINRFLVQRCDSTGALDWNGNYIKVSFSWLTKPMYVNRIIISVTEVGQQSSLYTNIAWGGDDAQLTDDNNKALRNGEYNIIIGSGISPDKSYEVMIHLTTKNAKNEVVKDDACVVRKISYDRMYLLDFLNGGRGIAIGKEATKDEFLEIDLETILLNTFYKNGYSIYGITSNHNGATENQEIETFTAMSAANNAVMGYGLYTNKIGDSRIYGNDVWFVSANAGGTVENLVGFIPYYRKYCKIKLDDNGLPELDDEGNEIPVFDTASKMNVCITTTGYLTSSQTKIYFTIPLDRPILGNPTITLKNDKGFILRQYDKNNPTDKGRYSHGSDIVNGVYAWAIPTSLTVLNTTTYPNSTATGIAVEATFKKDTNAYNNMPIGVDWIGTIEFT